MQNKNYDHMLKIVLVGNSGVGKSNFIHRYVDDKFYLESMTTIGVEYYNKIINVNDKIFKLQIWDTAGQERYDSITNMYIRSAQGIILMYDITNMDTFIQCKKWIENIKDICENAKIILIGNKSDLKYLRQVSQNEAKKFSDMNGINIIETSALESKNINDAFYILVNSINNDIAVLNKKNDNSLNIIHLNDSINIDKSNSMYSYTCCMINWYHQ